MREIKVDDTVVDKTLQNNIVLPRCVEWIDPDYLGT